MGSGETWTAPPFRSGSCLTMSLAGVRRMLPGGTELRFWGRFRARSFVLALAALWALGLQRGGAEELQPIAVTVKGGEFKEIILDLGTDRRPDLVFEATLDPSADEPRWPKDFLQVSLVQDRALVREVRVPYSPGGRKVVLRVTAKHCAPAGHYERDIRFEAADRADTRLTKVAETIPVEFIVAADPTCSWVKGGAIGIALLVVLAGFYLQFMVLNSVFLSPTILASGLALLRRTDSGDLEMHPGLGGELRIQATRQLSPVARARAWLAANPLIFGLPGNRYEETVRIGLARRTDLLSLAPVPRRRAYEHFRVHPDEARGHLFAKAEKNGSVSFFGMPDSHGQIDRLQPSKPLRPDQLAILSNLKLIEAEPGAAHKYAGWQILGSRKRA